MDDAVRGNGYAWKSTRTLNEYQDEIDKSRVPMQVSSSFHRHFSGRVRATQINEVTIAEVFSAGHAVERTNTLIRSSEQPAYHANLLLKGRSVLYHGDKEVVLAPGTLAVLDARSSYALDFQGDSHMVVVMCHPRMLGITPELIGAAAALTIPSRHPLGAIAGRHLTGVSQSLDAVGVLAGIRLVQTAVDILGTVVSAELDLTSDGATDSELLLRRVQKYVDERIGDQRITAAEVAAAHSVSVRDLQNVFRVRGATVTAWIRERRLERCRRELCDPLRAHLPVSVIAMRAGFANAAHFSRAFRAQFGESATGLRASAMSAARGSTASSTLDAGCPGSRG